MSSPASEPAPDAPAPEQPAGQGPRPPELQPPPEAPFPPWGLAAALAVVALFALTQLIVSLGAALLVRWVLPVAGGAGFARWSVPFTLFFSHAIGWCAVWVLVVKVHRLRLLEGLRLGHHPRRSVVLAFLGGMGLQFLSVLAIQFFPPPPDFVSPIENFLRLGRWAVIVLFLVAVLMAPTLEEVLFRGLLLPALRRRFAFPFSAAVVTVLFASLHATQTGAYWPPLIGIAVCGWFLARSRERTGSLWPPMAFHAGFNFTAFVPVLLLEILGREFLERAVGG